MFWEKFKKKDKDIIVVKIGGEITSDEKFLTEHVKDIVEAKEHVDFIIVSGGGKEISQKLEKEGIIPKFISGQRYTDSITLDIVIDVLDKNNKKIVNLVNLKEGNALSCSEMADHIFTAEKLIKDDIDLGYVGKIKNVNVTVVKNLLTEGFILVISPLCRDIF